jgi:phosphatidylglycerol---prolipoprotein diacylglyceryl transferase
MFASIVALALLATQHLGAAADAVTGSTGATLATATTALGLPYWTPPWHGPPSPFGIIVSIGIFVGAVPLRKYADWHGIHDDISRGLLWWVGISGFIGAHVFDTLAYQWHDFVQDPLLIVKFWSGISSYGGFLGGAIGYAIYTWWKRLPPLLIADTAMLGLLPAFTIGRLACTVVHDHVGSKTNFFLGIDYPANSHGNLVATTMHNLGLYELLYLLPVCAIALTIAFNKKRRLPAGFVAVLVGAMYAPVRFFLDYLRPEKTDPRLMGLTFAQWISLLAFSASVIVAIRVFTKGKPAELYAPTPKEALDKMMASSKVAAKPAAKPAGKS